jgi:hypothetical protein
MKRVAALTVVSVVAFAVAWTPLSNTSATPTGRTFRVTVHSSFGLPFPDCSRFDVPTRRDLTIARRFQTLTSRHGHVDEADARARCKAVSRSGQPLAILFVGEELEALEPLAGDHGVCAQHQGTRGQGGLEGVVCTKTFMVSGRIHLTRLLMPSFSTPVTPIRTV